MKAAPSVVVRGASGRIGRAVLGVLLDTDSLAAALVRAGSSDEDRAVRDVLPGAPDGLKFTSTLGASSIANVMIDFSVAAAFDGGLDLAVRRGLAFVSGTTGLDEHQRIELQRASQKIPVLWSANFSLGVAVLDRLVADAARMLADWDCEIAEVHHRNKVDAPSGTALALGRAVAAARDVDFDAVARLSRTGPDGARRDGDIGFAVTRAGDIVGEHVVTFATTGERIELVHRATDRRIFARGAVAAARWIVGRPPGLYTLGRRDIRSPVNVCAAWENRRGRSTARAIPRSGTANFRACNTLIGHENSASVARLKSQPPVQAAAIRTCNISVIKFDFDRNKSRSPCAHYEHLTTSRAPHLSIPCVAAFLLSAWNE